MTKAPLAVLGGISAEHFLKEYWQQKPLLIRNALPDYQSPISPDELAGLSLESEIESRIIIERQGNEHWLLERGPFESSRFEHLENHNWTLLVQQLDAWVPEANHLKRKFDFIPDWRVDDIMASFAPKGGSVGPHFDFYDVFLVQALGQRHWKLGQWCDTQTPVRSDTSLSILDSFETSEEWTLNPGDILYVPPKLAHFGVAENDCITLSVGFRAPQQHELVNGFVDYLLENNSHNTDVFFEDAQRAVQEHSGELKQTDCDALHALMLTAFENKTQFTQWLGMHLSEPKNESLLTPTDAEIVSAQDVCALLRSGVIVSRNEGSRLFYTLDQSAQRTTPDCSQKTLLFFFDGESETLSVEHLTFVQYLCSKDEYDAQTLLTFCNKLDTKQLIAMLLKKGSIFIETAE